MAFTKLPQTGSHICSRIGASYLETLSVYILINPREWKMITFDIGPRTLMIPTKEGSMLLKEDTTKNDLVPGKTKYIEDLKIVKEIQSFNIRGEMSATTYDIQVSHQVFDQIKGLDNCINFYEAITLLLRGVPIIEETCQQSKIKKRFIETNDRVQWVSLNMI